LLSNLGWHGLQTPTLHLRPIYTPPAGQEMAQSTSARRPVNGPRGSVLAVCARLYPQLEAAVREGVVGSRALGTSSLISGPVCACVYYCRTYYKAVHVCGGGDSGGHVLRETTSRDLCGLVCPSRTVLCVSRGAGADPLFDVVYYRRKCVHCRKYFKSTKVFLLIGLHQRTISIVSVVGEGEGGNGHIYYAPVRTWYACFGE